MWGENLYNQVSAVIKRMKLFWSKLDNGTTDGLPNFSGKKGWAAEKSAGLSERGKQPHLSVACKHWCRY